MKVLFVSSPLNKNKYLPDFHSASEVQEKVSPFTHSQGLSLSKVGFDVDFFLTKGNGLIGYYQSFFALKKLLSRSRYDLIHAHFSLCGLISILARRREKIVISFLGSDINGSFSKTIKGKVWSKVIISLSKFICMLVPNIIVKSDRQKKKLPLKYQKNISVIPNGVDFDLFKPLNRHYCRKLLNLNSSKKYVLFLGQKSDYNKNFKLVKKAMKKLPKEKYELFYRYKIPHRLLKFYFNSADVYVLSSFFEGSSNTLKESIACNCPVVSTDCGDSKKILENLKGSYITNGTSRDLANKIILASKYRNSYRNSIKHLSLDSTAQEICQIYINS